MSTTTPGAVDLRAADPIPHHRHRVTVDLADLAMVLDGLRSEDPGPLPDGWTDAAERLADLADSERVERGLLPRLRAVPTC